LGSAIVAALRAAGAPVTGPHGRGYDGAGDAVVLLCVPDDAIGGAAERIVPGPLIGHCSGASGLDVLGDRSAMSVHPLMTVTRQGADFEGVWAAVAGSDAEALAVATSLATTLGLRPVRVDDADRPAYHAAAAISANFLVTLESAAAELMSTAGLDREVLVPLATAALQNWARSGPSALTGPVVRGDAGTVALHRRVVAERTPHLVRLFDALVGATQRLAAADSTPDTGIGSAEPGASGRGPGGTGSGPAVSAPAP
jgi:predicted short-subunit dehydrogenase-like oxidoreductase (DUF2520 family)